MDHGMYSIYEYASRVGGLSHDSTRRILAIGEKLFDKPHLNKKFIEGEVGWGKIELVASIATIKDEKDWSKKITTMSFGALRSLIKKSVVHDGVDARDLYENLNLKLKRKTLSQFRVYKKRLEKKERHPMTWDDTVDTLLKNKTTVPPKPGRNIPKAKQDKLEEKYKGVCAFPTCTKPADVIHHPERYALTKNHDNLKPLCKVHHELAHHGLIKNEEQDPTTWELLQKPENSYLKRKIDEKYQKARLQSVGH